MGTGERRTAAVGRQRRRSKRRQQLAGGRHGHGSWAAAPHACSWPGAGMRRHGECCCRRSLHNRGKDPPTSAPDPHPTLLPAPTCIHQRHERDGHSKHGAEQARDGVKLAGLLVIRPIQHAQRLEQCDPLAVVGRSRRAMVRPGGGLLRTAAWAVCWRRLLGVLLLGGGLGLGLHRLARESDGALCELASSGRPAHRPPTVTPASAITSVGGRAARLEQRPMWDGQLCGLLIQPPACRL